MSYYFSSVFSLSSSPLRPFLSSFPASPIPRAKDEYLSENLTNEQKRTILAELFESVDYEDNSISVKLTKFVKSIEEKVYISKQILKEAKMNCRTNKNDPIYRGQTVENSQLELLCPIWQGHVESNHDLRFWRPIY